MDHETGIDVFVCACVDEAYFSSAAFFGWCPVQTNTAWYVGRLECGSDAEEGRDGRRRDEVVAACVADFRERVVLGIIYDNAAAGADFA